MTNNEIEKLIEDLKEKGREQRAKLEEKFSEVHELLETPNIKIIFRP